MTFFDYLTDEQRRFVLQFTPKQLFTLLVVYQIMFALVSLIFMSFQNLAAGRP